MSYQKLKRGPDSAFTNQTSRSQLLQCRHVISFAGIIRWRLPLVANTGRIRSRFKKDSDQLGVSRSCRLVQGSVASGLFHVYVRSLGDEKMHRLDILT